MIWITAVQFDRSGHDEHEDICAFRWRAADSQQQGRYTVAELIDLIRSDTLVYVSDEAFERTALVRVVDAEPPYVRAWAHGSWGNDLLALPRFDDSNSDACEREEADGSRYSNPDRAPPAQTWVLNPIVSRCLDGDGLWRTNARGDSRFEPARSPRHVEANDRWPGIPTHEEDEVPDSVYPVATRELTTRRKEAAPETHEAFQAFSRQVFADGALPEKTKQLIALAVAHVTQCPYCIRGHARLAQRRGASEQEIMEAIWVAAEMRAGGAYAHSVIALDALVAEDDDQRGERSPALRPEPSTAREQEA